MPKPIPSRCVLLDIVQVSDEAPQYAVHIGAVCVTFHDLTDALEYADGNARFYDAEVYVSVAAFNYALSVGV